MPMVTLRVSNVYAPYYMIVLDATSAASLLTSPPLFLITVGVMACAETWSGLAEAPWAWPPGGPRPYI